MTKERYVDDLNQDPKNKKRKFKIQEQESKKTKSKHGLSTGVWVEKQEVLDGTPEQK